MYIVEITLLDGMQTNYGKQLPVSRELKGTADIILADKNVLERLLAPLRKMVEYENEVLIPSSSPLYPNTLF